MHDDLRRRIDDGAANYEKAQRALLGPGGKPRYAADYHEEFNRLARSDFDAALKRIEGEISSRVERAEEKLIRLEHADPSAVLDARELEAANARRAFISEEVSGRSAEGLADRVKAVIASGDRPAMFLYAHYIRRSASSSLGSAGSGGEASLPEAERIGLEGLAAELEGALDPEAEPRLEKARSALEELRKIKDYAYLRRHGARDPVELYLNRAYGATR